MVLFSGTGDFGSKKKDGTEKDRMDPKNTQLNQKRKKRPKKDTVEPKKKKKDPKQTEWTFFPCG